MKPSTLQKDYFIISLIFLPLFCGSTMWLIASYSRESIGDWFAVVVNIQQVMKNVTYIAIGAVLSFQPPFFMRFLHKLLNSKDNRDRTKVIKSLFRLIGMMLIAIAITSSCYLIQETGVLVR